MKMKPIAPRIKCADGTTLSVQASQFHYCTPRQNRGPYSAVEVGYIEDKNGNAVVPPSDWREYADGGFPSDVYGYVPKRLVNDFIAQHGGEAQP